MKSAQENKPSGPWTRHIWGGLIAHFHPVFYQYKSVGFSVAFKANAISGW